jgi:hypothetical protein
MKEYFKALKPFFIGVAMTLLVRFILFTKGCYFQDEIIATTTDTVFVNRPYKEVVIKEVLKPQTVYVYRTDTVIRKIIERDTLISSLELTPRLARIHTITPKGVPMIKEYKLPDFRSLSIDHEGKMGIKKVKHPKRHKLLKTLGKVGIFAGGFFVGHELAK